MVKLKVNLILGTVQFIAISKFYSLNYYANTRDAVSDVLNIIKLDSNKNKKPI